MAVTHPEEYLQLTPWKKKRLPHRWLFIDCARPLPSAPPAPPNTDTIQAPRHFAVGMHRQIGMSGHEPAPPGAAGTVSTACPG